MNYLKFKLSIVLEGLKEILCHRIVKKGSEKVVLVHK